MLGAIIGSPDEAQKIDIKNKDFPLCVSKSKVADDSVDLAVAEAFPEHLKAL